MLLYGMSSHGQDIVAIHRRVHGRQPLYMIDDNPNLGMLADDEIRQVPCWVGINNPHQRAELVRKHGLIGARPLVDPSAIVGIGCDLGPGVVVAPNATRLTSGVLGSHSHANYNSHMTRCSIGDFSSIAPGVTICGDVTIGTECTIGANAVVCDRVTIGDNVIVGAGAIVPPLSVVPGGSIVRGVWKS